MVKFIGLKMQGIRSIGDTPHCINFLTPLTIIQGPNGTGKTTIIEALNYVTTGALPAGKMQTFIHNNQIAHQTRVDALVQLVFKDINGNTCTATKRMNASNTRGKLTTKSDEFSLKIVDKFGNPKSISSKVADFNKEMLKHLDVPKAVLEYVLFCHQEESNWPLSEPKELKVRFDAIFEVTKFVKALDNVKKMIKELNGQIQLIDKELPHLENNLRARVDLRMSCDQSQSQLRLMKKNVDKMMEQKQNLEKELSQTRKQVEKAQQANHDFEVLQGKINTHQRYMEGLSSLEFVGTRDDLVLAIENLKQSEAIQEADSQRAAVMSEIQVIGARIASYKKTEEAYREQQMQYDTRQMIMKNREEEYMGLLTQYSDKYGVPISPNFIEDLQAKVSAIEVEAREFLKVQQERANELNVSIQELHLRSAEYRNNNRTKREEFFKLSQAIAAAEKEFKSAENASQAVGKLATEIVKWEAQLKQLGDFKLLDQIWESLQSLQTELNTLRMDMLEMGDSSAIVGELKEKSTQTLEKASEKLDKTLEHIGTLKRRVQITNQLMEFKDRKATAGEKVIQMETLKQALDEKKERLTEVEKLLAASTRELPAVEKELQALETDRKAILQAINNKQREAAMHADSIQYAISKIAELKAANERDKRATGFSENFREKMEQQKAAIEAMSEQRGLLEARLHGVEQKKHQLKSLEEQLRRMDIQKEVDLLRHQLEEAKENAAVDGVENLADLRKKSDRLNQRAIEVNNQIHQRNGEQLQLRKKIDDLKRQLQDPRYEQAKPLYMDKLVERHITADSIQDLEQYYKIVDDAIINFHQQKMEQINQILCELWRRVYQGNDIENIKIKSQPVSGGEKKKSYDYSVVMTVDQTEIEMRDRCSAGQKVLASILIRIALADVFAGNCRILALDEPTTNLDHDKVDNIASILKSLIEIQGPFGGGGGTAGSGFGARDLNAAEDADFIFNDTAGTEGGDEEMTRDSSSQLNDTTSVAGTSTTTTMNNNNDGGGAGADHRRSLQLIVITHDRHLVEQLHLACRPDYIYGLSKDEKGVSRIKAHSNISSADADF